MNRHHKPGGTAAPPSAEPQQTASAIHPDSGPRAASPPGKVLPVRSRPVHLPNIKRSNEPVILFVTVCTHGRKAVLAKADVHDALIGAWSRAQAYRVGCYVVMPDHLHIFCSPTTREPENVSRWVAYWKRQVSLHLPRLAPLWQRNCWDTQLRSVDHYGRKWEYVRANPVRQKLVRERDGWPYQGCLNELRW